MEISEIKKYLGDRKWRLNNLYFITDEKGNKVQFRMNKVQEYLYDNLWYLTITPKARQLGITTFFSLLYFDQVLFSKNKTAGIIAHRYEDMKKIFRTKIRFAWNNLHPWLKEKIGEPKTESAYEMSFPNGSSIFVSMSTRSGTVNFLHISELGYICQKYPEKAEEIKTGSLNSVHAGQMISIESTAKGKEGLFYRYCMTAENLRKSNIALTPLDFKIFFFPWYEKDSYKLSGNVMISEENKKYFKSLKEKYGIELTTDQKNWYIKKKEQNENSMFEEFPSNLDECFMAETEGSYYAKEMSKVYLSGRICPLPYDSNIEVDTWWDLGMNDFNVILFTQSKGPQIRFIDMYHNRGEGLKHYYDILKEKKKSIGYSYGTHYFPHDIKVKELGTGISRKQTLYDLGMRNIRVGPKADFNDGIEKVRGLFSKFYFDEVKTKVLYDALFNYRKKFDDKIGVFKDKPIHNDASHFSDVVRLIALMWKERIREYLDDSGKNEKDDECFFS